MSTGILPDSSAAERLDEVIDPVPDSAGAGERRRSGAHEVGQNAFWLLVSFVVLGITQFGVLGLITRFGGVEEAGIWAYANAFRDPFLAFMDFGTTGLLVAEIARRRKESDVLLSNGIALGLLIGGPVLVVMFVTANLGFLQLSPLMIKAIYWTGISALIFTTAASFRSAFRAFNRLKYEAILSVAIMVISVASAFVILYYGYPFIWLFAAMAVARLVALLGSWWFYNTRLGTLKLAISQKIMRQLLSKTWAFTIVGLLSRAFTRVDILILGFYHGEAAAGYYGLATTLFYQLNTVAQLITTAILPNMAEAYVKRRERVGFQVDAAVRLQILVGLPATAIGVILAPQIIRFFYGPGYENTILIFQLLVMVVVLRFVNQTVGVVLTAMDQQHRRAATLTATVAFNIILNFALVPRYSFMGATLTAVLSEVVLFTLTYLAIDRDVRKQIRWGRLLRPFLSTLCLLPVLFLMRDWPLILSLAASGIVFAVAIMALRAIPADEARLMADLIAQTRRLPVFVRRFLAAFIRRSGGLQPAPAPAGRPTNRNGSER